MLDKNILKKLDFYDKENNISFCYRLDENNNINIYLLFDTFKFKNIENIKHFYYETCFQIYNDNNKWYIKDCELCEIHAYAIYSSTYIIPSIWYYNNGLNEEFNEILINFNIRNKLLNFISIYKYKEYDIKIKKVIINLILILKDKLPIEMINKILSFLIVIDFF